MVMPIEAPHPAGPVPPSRAHQLCDYVIRQASSGYDVATILAGALELFSEEPPADRAEPTEYLRGRRDQARAVREAVARECAWLGA
jgi:hypothetical protein